MLYICFVTTDAADRRSDDIQLKSRQVVERGRASEWFAHRWSYGAVGTDTPDVLVLETEDHMDLQKMIDFWAPVHIEIHPAMDLGVHWRERGMNIE